MMRPMEISGADMPQERTNRLRQGILLIVGLILVAGMTLSVPKNSDGSGGGSGISSMIASLWGQANENEDLFDNVDSEEEESFVSTTKRSAINTLKLPYVPPQLSAENVTSSTATTTLYLQVGPVHSGIPKLYEQLDRMQDLLLQDKLVVANASHPYIDITALRSDCQSELVSARQNFGKKKKLFGKQKSLPETLRRDVACWKKFLDTLDWYRGEEVSVLISDEQLSQQILPNVPPLDGPAVLDWIAIFETLQADWNIVVVTSYRRYFDWLPAAKGADEQVHMVQKTAEPPRLARWPRNEGGMLLEPLFPHFYHHALQKLDVPYTARVVELFGGFSAVRVLNLYVPNQSVLTTLLCDVLNSAPASCEASRQWDTSTDPTPNATAILDLEGEYEWSDFQLFDELVTTGAARSIIRFRHVTRPTATVTTQYYIEQYLGIHPRRDLPLKCPKEGQLQDLLRQSVRYESMLLGEELAAISKASLKQEFMIQSENRMFCSMNMRKVFRDRSWRIFMRHLTNKSAKRIMAGGDPGPQPYQPPIRRLLAALQHAFR